MKKKSRKFLKNLKNASFVSLSIVFGWMILQGALAILPEITGITLVIIGVVGLSIIGFWGYNN